LFNNNIGTKGKSALNQAKALHDANSGNILTLNYNKY